MAARAVGVAHVEEAAPEEGHKLSAAQLNFIEQIKKEINALVHNGEKPPVWFYPPNVLAKGKVPLPQPYWVKPVVVWIPHYQFPDAILRCPCGSESPCDGIVRPKGYPSDFRYVHDMNSGVYLLQYQYVCKQSSCGKKTNSTGLQLPGNLNNLCPVILTHKSAVTRDVLTFITSAATTGMSFSEMGKHMGTTRLTKYLDCFTDYNVRLQYYRDTLSGPNKLTSSTSLTPYAEFGAFDDKTGFNEIARPSDQFLEKLFIEYVKQHDEFIVNVESQRESHPVISIDHTNNVSKRSSRGENSALFSVLGGNGQVYSAEWCQDVGRTLFLSFPIIFIIFTIFN